MTTASLRADRSPDEALVVAEPIVRGGVEKSDAEVQRVGAT
jgi:hypothetical protein